MVTLPLLDPPRQDEATLIVEKDDQGRACLFFVLNKARVKLATVVDGSLTFHKLVMDQPHAISRWLNTTAYSFVSIYFDHGDKQ